MDADIFPLASRMPVSMASLLRSDSVKPFRNSSSYGTRNRSKNKNQSIVQQDHNTNVSFFA